MEQDKSKRANRMGLNMVWDIDDVKFVLYYVVSGTFLDIMVNIQKAAFGQPQCQHGFAGFDTNIIIIINTNNKM